MSWIISTFNNNYELMPKVDNINKFISQKCYDKLNFNIYNEIYEKDDKIVYDNIFDMFGKKYNNFIDSKLKNKLCINYEDLLYNHFKIIKHISNVFNMPIKKEYNKEFDNYEKKDYYLNNEFLKKYDYKLLENILSNIDDNSEKNWIKNIKQFDYTKNRLSKFEPNKSFRYAILFYFDGEQEDLFKLKLSIYLFKKKCYDKVDIFVYYKNEINFTNFDEKIRFIKTSLTEIDLYYPEFVNSNFTNYEYLIYLKYDLFIDDEILLNNIYDYKSDVVLFNIYKEKFDNKPFIEFNKTIDYELFTKKILNFDICQNIDSNIIIFKTKFFEDEKIINFFDIVKNKLNDKNLFFHYFNYCCENFSKININFNYYTGSLDN